MVQHRTRLIAITVLLVIALVGLIVLTATGTSEGTVFGALLGVVGTLIPALTDAGRVQLREGRAPGDPPASSTK